jgi:hypothetical protein
MWVGEGGARDLGNLKLLRGEKKEEEEKEKEKERKGKGVEKK